MSEIDSIDELITLLRLTHFDKQYPPPFQGDGTDVIELEGMHSWDCLRAALENLSDDDMIAVLQYKKKFTFHNNVSNPHASMGASWTIKEFINVNGGTELRAKAKELL